VSQIQDLVCIGCEKWEHKVLDSWPGPNTWVIPVKKELPEWITGGRETLAVRVSAHPVVQKLCLEFGGPIVSTSANPSTKVPAKTAEEAYDYFDDLVYYLHGSLGSLENPTQIRDAQTGQLIRV
jgi:L-threonylcarbamoyladenylate synthase